MKPLTGQDGPVEREMEESLVGVARAAILTTMYPRTLISITVQVIHDDGALPPRVPPRAHGRDHRRPRLRVHAPLPRNEYPRWNEAG